jgi:predicted PurR-regulated permease PerM
VLLALGLLAGVGMTVLAQLKSLATDLPEHEREIVAKIQSVREASKGSWLDSVYATVQDITQKIEEVERSAEKISGAEPVPVKVESSSIPWLQSVIDPIFNILLTSGLVIVLVVFMLIQREDLRNRMIRLLGSGNLTTLTRAVDDGVRRISRYLLAQLVINTFFGLAFGIGLFLIGVPYAALWGFLAGILRYIPYIGSWVAAALPFAVSIIVLAGWTKPLLVIGIFLLLEMLTFSVLEPWFFGQSIGVSAVALLFAAAFWTWLWGPIGLVIATPLTACLVVLGGYVPQLEFFYILLGDEPVLEPHITYYQRLLAKDQDEASDLVEEYLHTHSVAEVYDQVFLPALVLTKQNQDTGDFTPDDEKRIYEVTRELMDEIGLSKPDASPNPSTQENDSAEGKVLVFGCPSYDEGDELALHMLSHLIDPRNCDFEVIPAATLAGEMIERVRQENPALICIAALPPKGIVHTRYLCKRLRSQFPDLKILVGCWGLEHNVDRTRERLLAAGADQVGTSLRETRDRINPLIQVQAHIQQKQTLASPVS